MKKWDKVAQNNHLKLMKIHLAMIVFYCLILLVVFWILPDNTLSQDGQFVLIFYSIPIILHTFLAWGAKQKLELSRRISTGIFVFMFLAVPIGTIIAMTYGLPATQWKHTKKNDV